MNQLKKLIKKINPREKIMVIILVILLLILTLKTGIRRLNLTRLDLPRSSMADLEDRIYMVNNYEEESEKLNRAIKVSKNKNQNLEGRILDSQKLDELILSFFSSNINIEEYRLSDTFDQVIDGTNYEMISLILSLNGNFQDIYLLLSDMEKSFSNIELIKMDLSFLDNNSCNCSLEINVFLANENISLDEVSYDKQ